MAGPLQSDDFAELARGFVDPQRDREVKRGYLRWFEGAHRVLDVGCGRGVFLELLRDVGIPGSGIDSSAAAIQACRDAGLDAVESEARSALGECAARGERFSGILVAHLLEHLAPRVAAELIARAAAVLEAGGRMIFVTPDVRNRVVLEETFWLDPTHVRPYPRALVERLCERVGLRIVASYGDPATVPLRPGWKRALVRLRSFLSGADRSSPMDSVVVVERP